MASSDDEGDTIPNNVSEYDFVDGKDDPISFAELPVEWHDGSKTSNGKVEEIFLRGKTDGGLRMIYKQIIAWKFDLSSMKPEISVKTLEGPWIMLLKPRKAFEIFIKSILVTVHFLHFVKQNPGKPQNASWDHLSKSLSTFETDPSEDDLQDHLSLINESVKRDETLQKSELLAPFLGEKPRKRKASNENVKPSFIVDDSNVDSEMEADTADKSEEEDDVDDGFDSVCAICDNGGQIIICEGKCMRSFHATKEDGEESECKSLGFTAEEYEAINKFYCKNCEFKQHQCFACGELGSSDELSSAEVFCCVNGACGHFYHPACVAKLLHPENESQAEEHREKIASGEQFSCPVHRCHVCKKTEVRTDHDLQFAICRRCPRAYHRKCLPRKIAFEEDVKKGRADTQRAWEGLIPDRILIYCLKHKINGRLLTPDRNHIKFPGPKEKLNRNFSLGSEKKVLLKERVPALEDIAGNRFSAKSSKAVEKLSFSSKKRDLLGKKVEKLPPLASFKKQKVSVSRSRSLVKTDEFTGAEDDLGNRLYDIFCSNDPGKEETIRGGPEKNQEVKPITKNMNNSSTLDAQSRERVSTLMKNASSSITLEDIKKKHEATHFQYSKFAADNITLGKVEGAIQAVRAALKILEEGGSVEDAKTVCGNDLVGQVMEKWKEKLKVYLAPFLHGMRYTSFGRHFTKVDKLKEVVDMLHWYAQDDDMIVDFCCGSNDFSCLLKEKLDEVGKKCLFKNFDIVQPKNDFNFERRDWMKVGPKELPEGSQLIMGLNPPFGVNCCLANKFINQALKFKPKLLILIVPRETERLDKKRSPYDLIWEDDQMCNGKSFYLPGSVDVNDKQIEDWNKIAPVVYLWSRPDWTLKHKNIAEQHGHPSGARQKYGLEETNQVMHIPNSPQKDHNPEEPLVDPVENGHRQDEEENLDTKFLGTSHDDDLKRDTGKKRSKNHQKAGNSESNPKAFGGKRKKNRRFNNISKEDKSSSKHIVPAEVRFSEAPHSSEHFESASNDHDWMNNCQYDDRGCLPTYSTLHRTEHDHDSGIRYAQHNPSLPGRNVVAPVATPGYSYMPSADAWAESWAPHAGFSSQYALNPSASNSYLPVSTSATQRYSSGLNNYNHTAGGNMYSGPSVTHTFGYSHQPAPRPQHSSFAPAWPSYSQQNSNGGWIFD